MSKIGKRLVQRLRRLAQLRAAGHSWAAIAAETGWSASACETLAAKHAGRWRRYLRAALQLRALETLVEGLTVLRLGLREDDWRIRRMAAVGIGQYVRLLDARRTRKRPEQPRAESDLAATIAYLERLSAGEAEQMVEELLVSRQAAGAPGTNPLPPNQGDS